MSAFGFFEKDEVVFSIENLIKEEINRGKTPREAIVSVMEAVTYAIQSGLYIAKDMKVDDK